MNEKFGNIKGLIFDYGGTLDSEGRHWSYILREGLKAAGTECGDDSWKDAYVFAERALAKERIILAQDTFRDVMLKKIGIEISRLIETGAIALPESEKAECITKAAEYCYRYAANCIERSRNALEKLGGFKMVLVTNFYGNMHSVLKDFKLDFFRDIIESSCVGVRKPDPQIYRLGVENLGVAAGNTVVIGDSYDKDIIPASSIGCKTIWLKGEGWGNPPKDTSAADAVITSISQLPQTLGQICAERWVR